MLMSASQVDAEKWRLKLTTVYHDRMTTEPRDGAMTKKGAEPRTAVVIGTAPVYAFLC
jgi:hypothetical protein